MNKPLPRTAFGKQFDENFDRIFGKKEPEQKPKEIEITPEDSCSPVENFEEKK